MKNPPPIVEEYVVDICATEVKALAKTSFLIDQDPVKTFTRLLAAAALAGDMIDVDHDNAVQNLRIFLDGAQNARTSNHPANTFARTGH